MIISFSKQLTVFCFISNFNCCSIMHICTIFKSSICYHHLSLGLTSSLETPWLHSLLKHYYNTMNFVTVLNDMQWSIKFLSNNLRARERQLWISFDLKNTLCRYCSHNSGVISVTSLWRTLYSVSLVSILEKSKWFEKFWTTNKFKQLFMRISLQPVYSPAPNISWLCNKRK